jgi:hypothetical protein
VAGEDVQVGVALEPVEDARPPAVLVLPELERALVEAELGGQAVVVADGEVDAARGQRRRQQRARAGSRVKPNVLTSQMPMNVCPLGSGGTPPRSTATRETSRNPSAGTSCSVRRALLTRSSVSSVALSPQV